MYERPFVSSRFTAYPGSVRQRDLRLAIRFVDEHTGLAPLGRFRVFLKERKGQADRGQEPILNPSGFYCFLDVPAGDYTIVAEPSGATLYWHRSPDTGALADIIEQTVRLPDDVLPLPQPAGDPPDPPLNPVVEVSLAPNPTYPFSPSATLMRGQAQVGGQPAVGAILSAPYSSFNPADPDDPIPNTARSRTDSAGHFVLFFRSPAPAGQPGLTVTAEFEGAEKTQDVDLEEGRSVAVPRFEFP